MVRREYDDDGIVMPGITLEKYFDEFRASWTVTRSRLLGGGAATGHVATLDWYYGAEGHSRIGLAAGFGDEVEGTDKGVISTRVRSLHLRGVQDLDEAWAITWSVGLHEQGSLYTRRGAHLGLLLRF